MRDLIKIFKALSDETRLRILNLMIERDCCVCEVMQTLEISQTRASRNLSQLYDAGLLEQRREGLWTIYYLSPRVTADYRNLIVNSVENALNQDDRATADRLLLQKSNRLCPVTEVKGGINGSPKGIRCVSPVK